MMGRALLVVGALATLGLLATAILGYAVPEEYDPVSLSSHLLLLALHNRFNASRSEHVELRLVDRKRS